MRIFATNLKRCPYKDGYHAVDLVRRACSGSADPIERAVFIRAIGAAIRHRYQPDIEQLTQFYIRKSKMDGGDEISHSVAMERARADTSHRDSVRTQGREGSIIAADLKTLSDAELTISKERWDNRQPAVFRKDLHKYNVDVIGTAEQIELVIVHCENGACALCGAFGADSKPCCSGCLTDVSSNIDDNYIFMGIHKETKLKWYWKISGSGKNESFHRSNHFTPCFPTLLNHYSNTSQQMPISHYLDTTQSVSKCEPLFKHQQVSVQTQAIHYSNTNQ